MNLPEAVEMYQNCNKDCERCSIREICFLLYKVEGEARKLGVVTWLRQ